MRRGNVVTAEWPYPFPPPRDGSSWTQEEAEWIKARERRREAVHWVNWVALPFYMDERLVWMGVEDGCGYWWDALGQDCELAFMAEHVPLWRELVDALSLGL